MLTCKIFLYLIFCSNFFSLRALGKKKCNNLIEQLTPRWLPLASSPWWFVYQLPLCNCGISRRSLRERSFCSSSSTIFSFFHLQNFCIPTYHLYKFCILSSIDLLLFLVFSAHSTDNFKKWEQKENNNKVFSWSK